MRRALATAAIALPLLGAARPTTVDYRLGVLPQAAGAPPVADVEIRLRGDMDGETRLDLPDQFADGTEAWRRVYDLTVKGAKVSEDGPAHRLLRHRPGAKLVVRYKVSTAYAEDPAAGSNPYRGAILRPDWMALLGEFVFAAPAGRSAEPATFQWGKLPPGWKAMSDLEHGAQGARMTVGDVTESITLGGTRLVEVQRPITDGALRVATFEGAPFQLNPLADEIARTVGAQRAYWGDVKGPYFVGMVPLARKGGAISTGGTGRGDGFVLYSTPGAPDTLGRTIGHEHTHGWIPARVGVVSANEAQEAAQYWLTEGFTDFVTDRVALRAGLEPPATVVGRMAAAMKAYDASPVRTAPNTRIVADFWKDNAVQQLAYQRGALLALKWDDEIRRKTGGKADLDDVLLQMRNHFAKFAPGQAPDPVTALVSAAWVVAQFDLRPDIARFVDRGEAIVLPEEMFDGCLQAAITVSPGFDAGFNAEASFAAKKAVGVRRRGPAWNSGLRDGMALQSWKYRAGDMTQMIEVTVRPPGKRARPRTFAYWPYGDADVQTRALRLTPGMSDVARAACGRKIGGL